VVANYNSRNISLLEFTDFFESYRTSMVQWYQLQNDRADAIEALNFAVSVPIIITQ
jgi:cobalt-zinc-cadmium efflux system outer membrane protein